MPASAATLRTLQCVEPLASFVCKLRHTLIVDRAGLTRAQVIVQPGNVSFDEPRTPLSHGDLGELQARGDGAIEFAVSASENDARLRAQRGRQRAND